MTRSFLTIESRLLDSLETYLKSFAAVGYCPADKSSPWRTPICNSPTRTPTSGNLLFRASAWQGTGGPRPWYTEKKSRPLHAKKSSWPSRRSCRARSQGDIERAAGVLWASLHGITSLSDGQSAVECPPADYRAGSDRKTWLQTYLDGLEAKPTRGKIAGA